VLAAVAVPLACVGLGGGGLAAAGGPPARLLAAAVALLPGSPTGAPGGEAGGRAALGAAGVAGAAWLWYVVAIVPAWRGWERAEIDSLFERRPRRPRARPTMLFSLVAGVPPLAAAAVLPGVGRMSPLDGGEGPARSSPWAQAGGDGGGPPSRLAHAHILGQPRRDHATSREHRKRADRPSGCRRAGPWTASSAG
jgi:hypothetical protein